jgi:stage II sporulation protein AA (anti-sigma F factor antagonist)
MPELDSHSDLITHARHEGETLLLTLAGEVDLNLSNDLRTALFALIQKTKVRQMVMNLSAVPYMDSSAMAVLLESMQKLRRLGGKVYLTHAQPRVKGLIEMAKLDTIFGVYASEADALKAIAGAAV